MRVLHLDFTPNFAVGDPAPSGYVAWHEWAAVQHRGGLRQAKCPRCGKWRYPQEPCRKVGVCPTEDATR